MTLSKSPPCFRSPARPSRATCTAVLVTILALTLPLPAAGPPRTARQARRVMADLLKIPLQPPEVSVVVRDRRVVDGLVIEDLSWRSLDGQEVPDPR